MASTSSASTEASQFQRKDSVTSQLSILKLTDQSASRRLLLPVDTSEHSERAFRWFLGNLYRQGDTVELAFVVEPPQYPPSDSQSASSFVQEGNKAYNDGLKEAKKLKVKFFDVFNRAGGPEEDFNFRELIGSKPADTLVKYINDSDIDCVVIGSRGLGKIKRAFLGSVSSHLLHHANCPVIICPNKKDKKDKDKDKKDKKGKKGDS